ncbi:helix-turn-helix transcriptional regulator [Actinomadura sp. HBU206391]|uniref:helix-turn-helix transcriptional regulator n=1 Tax=Actinomadura sp. HBU206391 TaxID=2731692 RepID=UPI00164EEC7C|nr:LuxR family transcriptional regulator [Actinomadura sp. HBU206391]MBC6462809.1 AAA family ATPase [Actinomadura sp. HBU206391]
MDGRVGEPPYGTPPLVGRRDVLQAFGAALDVAADGAFQLLGLVGEPGAGKTRLLGELASIATERRLDTLWGRAAEFEQQTPFGVVIDALDDRIEGLDEVLADRLEAPALRVLASVFPSLSAAVPEKPDDGEDITGLARYRLYRAVRRLLDELAGPNGLVLVLDDVHWADDSSIELLDHLIRHPPRGRVLVAVAYRPAQASPRLTALVEAGGGGHVPVEPLTEAEVAELLGPQVSPARRRSLFEASGGNPFYLEALARSEVPIVSGHEEGELPPAVSTALRVELSGLSSTARLVTQAAAMTADEFEPALAAVAAQVPDHVALTALDEMVARDVVRPAPSAGRFRFRHPLVRHAAYGSAAAGWRFAAHARIAAHLADLGASATVRAHHVERSGRFGDREAITTLVGAARAVAAQAPAIAAHWLKAALRLMPDTLDPGDVEPTGRDAPVLSRLELLMEQVHVQTLSGQLQEGRETARTLLRLLPLDDYARRAKAVHLCAVIERQLDRPHEARALVLDELRRIPDPQASAAVVLRVRLVADRLMRVDTRGAQAVLDLMPKSAPGWEPWLEVAVAVMRPLPAYGAGRIAEAVRHAEAADEALAGASDDHLAECLDSVAWLCWTELMMGRYDDALRHVDRSLAVARSTGQSYILTYLLAARARTLTMLGRLAEASAVAEEATEVARLLRSGECLAFALTQQCLVASWTGDHDSALRLGEEAVQNDVGSGEWWGAMARYARAMALVNAGTLEEGAAGLLEACGHGTAPMLDPGTLVACSEALAYVDVARGRPDEAAKWADIAAQLAHPDLDTDKGLVHLARAHALRPRDPATAAEVATQAAEMLLAAGRRAEAGRARLTAGLAYSEAGKRGPARETLRVAAEIFAECGARNLHAQTVREQRRLGVRVPATGGTGRADRPFGLTPREHEIAMLVAEGCTNQQIAEKLVLSVRTVETHLSRVFAKLGVGSRVGVATALNPRV